MSKKDVLFFNLFWSLQLSNQVKIKPFRSKAASNVVVSSTPLAAKTQKYKKWSKAKTIDWRTNTGLLSVDKQQRKLYIMLPLWYSWVFWFENYTREREREREREFFKSDRSFIKIIKFNHFFSFLVCKSCDSTCLI